MALNLVREEVVVGSAAALRATPNNAQHTKVVFLTGLKAGVVDSHGGLFVYDPANTQVDNGTTVIRPTGVTVGAWVRLSRYQEIIHFDQAGALASGAFSRLVSRGGYYGSFVAKLGTAGSVASTVAIAINGTTVATITFAIAATVGTIAYVAGANFSAANGDKITFTVTAGTAAADLTLVLDV
jgi:hypothetical protein